MLVKDDERLYNFLCYEIDEDFQDIFTEFIHELSCVDLSEKTIQHLYELFIKDMIVYFDKKDLLEKLEEDIEISNKENVDGSL